MKFLSFLVAFFIPMFALQAEESPLVEQSKNISQVMKDEPLQENPDFNVSSNLLQSLTATLSHPGTSMALEAGTLATAVLVFFDDSMALPCIMFNAAGVIQSSFAYWGDLKNLSHTGKGVLYFSNLTYKLMSIGFTASGLTVPSLESSIAAGAVTSIVSNGCRLIENALLLACRRT